MRQIDCTIERRLLVNYRLEPDVLGQLLPDGLRPQIVQGVAVGGVCFLRLAKLRPAGIPSWAGMRTENVAHRFAVEWKGPDGWMAGVYVPRRETNSRFAAWSGGRVFPGIYRHAQFLVAETGETYHVDVRSDDGDMHVAVRAHETTQLSGSLFSGVSEAMAFFRSAPSSISPNETGTCLEGVTLECTRWVAKPLEVDEIHSSLFDDRRVFPDGTVSLDSALVMRDLDSRFSVDDRRHELVRQTDPSVAGV